MKKAHLSTARLLAIRDGDIADVAAVAHLVSCPTCQRVFDDTRWLALLGQLRRREPDDEHPDLDELFAYRSRALSPSRLAEVGRHVRSCDRCLAAFRRERLEDRALEYSSPRPKLVAQVRRRFRPQLRQLGTVLVRRLENRLAVFFVPETAGVGSGLDRLAAVPRESRRDQAKGHPGSARRRARRLEFREEVASEPIEMSQETMDVSPGDAILGAALDGLAERAGPNEAAKIGGTALIRSGEHSLAVESNTADEKPILTLNLSSTASDEPVEGIRVVSVTGKGESHEVSTDPDGKATLNLMPGRFEIRVHVSPPFSFRLEFPD